MHRAIHPTNPAERASANAPALAAETGLAIGVDRGRMGSTWVFDGPCAQLPHLERGDPAP